MHGNTNIKKKCMSNMSINTHWWYPYFDILVGIACSNDPERYASRSVATCRVYHAGTPWSSRLGVRHETNNLTPLKKVHIEKTSNLIQMGQVHRRWPGYNKQNLIFSTWDNWILFKTRAHISLGQVNRRWPGYNKQNLIFSTRDNWILFKTRAHISLITQLKLWMLNITTLQETRW
jgi:hypothetical protein